MSESYYVMADGTSPGIVGFKSAFKRSDGVVVATDAADRAALIAAGYVPLQAMDGEASYFGQTRFEFPNHSALLAAIR
jgi:predicted ribosome-associated RNA-binding protein Tma20